MPEEHDLLCRVKSTWILDKLALRTVRGQLAFYPDRIEFTPNKGDKTPLVIRHADIETWKPVYNPKLGVLIRLVVELRDEPDEFRFSFFFMDADTINAGLAPFPPRLDEAVEPARRAPTRRRRR